MIPLALVLLADAVTRNSAPITVEIHNVRNARGRVLVAVCPHGRFLAASCPYHGEAPAQPGTTTITVPDVPPGDYAVQAFHDENSNDRIDRGLFGIPKEGVGFSRDARIVLSPPKWADAVFAHGAVAQTVQFSLRYFMGPGNPAEWKQRHPGE